jgi:hypothetical protein
MTGGTGAGEGLLYCGCAAVPRFLQMQMCCRCHAEQPWLGAGSPTLRALPPLPLIQHLAAPPLPCRDRGDRGRDDRRRDDRDDRRGRDYGGERREEGRRDRERERDYGERRGGGSSSRRERSRSRSRGRDDRRAPPRRRSRSRSRDRDGRRGGGGSPEGKRARQAPAAAPDAGDEIAQANAMRASLGLKPLK